MIIAGVDLGGRKVAISIFADGVLTSVADLTVPQTSRAMELRTLAEWSYGHLKVCDLVMVEEPLIGRGVRASLQIAQTAGAVMATLGGTPWSHKSSFVPVASWKKEVCGSGNLNKEAVADWLKSSHPAYAALCGANQDRIDSCCIGLYGVLLHDRAGSLADL